MSVRSRGCGLLNIYPDGKTDGGFLMSGEMLYLFPNVVFICSIPPGSVLLSLEEGYIHKHVAVKRKLKEKLEQYD